MQTFHRRTTILVQVNRPAVKNARAGAESDDALSGALLTAACLGVAMPCGLVIPNK